jgi:hypothetical protein
VTTANRLWRWLRQARGPFCDECVARELELRGRAQANRATRALAGRSNFYRDTGICKRCGAVRKVIESV